MLVQLLFLCLVFPEDWKWKQMPSDGLQHAAQCAAHGQNNLPHVPTVRGDIGNPRWGREIDSTFPLSLSEQQSYTGPGKPFDVGQQVHLLLCVCFVFFSCFFFLLFFLNQGQWWSGRDLDVTALFRPSCTLHKAYLLLPLFLTQRAQTHSHGQLPFNSQLGIRKLECWGELHKKNINVNKKTGTCVAISCHQKNFSSKQLLLHI